MVTVKHGLHGVQIGKVRGRYEVIGHSFSIGNHKFVNVCRCSCGKIVILGTLSLVSGSLTNRECNGVHGGHGESRQKLYRVWSAMKDRCSNKQTKCYPQYGGRGIEVCRQWAESYLAFRNWAVANGYQDGLQIDRIDNNGNYQPDNCRWVSQSQNIRNSSITLKLTAFGETKCLSEWIRDERCVASRAVVRRRLASGMSVEESLVTTSEPVPQRS